MQAHANTHWDDKLYRQGKQFVINLFMMIKTAQLYDPNNAAFTNTVDQFHEVLTELATRVGPVSVESVEDLLFINEEKIKSDIYTHATFGFINTEFEKRKFGGITFDKTTSKDHLKKFAVMFSRFQATAEHGADQFNQLLVSNNLQSITTTPKRTRHIETEQENIVQTNKASAVRNYLRAVNLVKESMTKFETTKDFDIRKAKRIVYNLVQHSFDEGYAFVGLSTIKNYDAYTFHHCVNVCVISITFGQNLGLNKRQLADLGIGALYHDIGKVNIPKDVLNKPGSFTDEEWHLMKKHPILAVQHLLPLRGATDIDIKKVVPAFEHHRNYDLSGYPAATIRKPLNFYSKVVAIADAFDAMTSTRTYQEGKLPSEALQIILKAAGKKFDPVLVKAFINTMGIYPVGSLVQMNNGFLGIVTEVNKDPSKSERPKVSIMMDAKGNLRREKLVDLSGQEFDNISITKVVDPETYNVNIAHYLLGTESR